MGNGLGCWGLPGATFPLPVPSSPTGLFVTHTARMGSAGAASSSLHTQSRIRPGHTLAKLLPLPWRSLCQITPSFTPQIPTSLQPASCNRPPPAPGLSCCSRAQLHGLGVPRHPHRGGDPGARLGPHCSAEGAEMPGREPGASRLHQHPSLGMLRGVSRRNGDSGTGFGH